MGLDRVIVFERAYANLVYPACHPFISWDEYRRRCLWTVGRAFPVLYQFFFCFFIEVETQYALFVRLLCNSRCRHSEKTAGEDGMQDEG